MTSTELYQAFDTILDQHDFTDFTFANAFKTWETQIGYPLVEIKIDNDAKTFVVSQQRYFAATDVKPEEDNRSWFIPLNFATASDPDFADTTITDYLPNELASKAIPFPSEFDATKWFVFNKQQLGYFRVNYEDSNWREIIKVLKSDDFKQIHVLNRAQLVDDSLNLAADGFLNYEIAFELVSYMEHETDYIPWKAAANNLEKLDFLLKDRPIYEWFKTFVRKITRHAFVSYGWEKKQDESLMDQQARELVIEWTCRMGDERCLTKTYKALESNEVIPPALEIAYICNGLRGYGKQKEFAAIMKRFKESNDQSERLRLIDGMACSSDPVLLMDLLSSTLNMDIEFNFRSYERSRTLSSVYSRSTVGIPVLCQFIEWFADEITET